MSAERKIFELFGVRHIPNRVFGIEVEAEFAGVPDLVGERLDNFRVEVDGSLMGNGYEFITRTPSDMETISKNVKSLFDQRGFKELYRPSFRTSTHIHANVSDKTKKQLFTILAGYYLLEPFIIHFAGKARTSNLFCLGLWEAEYGLKALEYLYEESKDLGRNFDQYKYSALNIANIPKIGTIEFRMFPGTSRSQEVDKYLGIVNQVLKFDIKYKSAEDVFEDFIQNKQRFLLKNLPELYNIGVDNPDYYDYNYSNVFNIINLEAYCLRKKAASRGRVQYKFREEMEYDDIENFVEL